MFVSCNFICDDLVVMATMKLESTCVRLSAERSIEGPIVGTGDAIRLGTKNFVLHKTF